VEFAVTVADAVPKVLVTAVAVVILAPEVGPAKVTVTPEIGFPLAS
jgi:hypothetical protein